MWFFTFVESQANFSFIGAAAISKRNFWEVTSPLFWFELLEQNVVVCSCIPTDIYVSNHFNDLEMRREIQPNLNGKKEKNQSFWVTIQSAPFLKRSFWPYLAAILGMSVLVAKMRFFRISIATSPLPSFHPDDLAQFFAFWSSNFNLISLLVQVFS